MEMVEFNLTAATEHAVVTGQIRKVAYNDTNNYTRRRMRVDEELHPQAPAGQELARQIRATVIGPDPLSVKNQLAACCAAVGRRVAVTTRNDDWRRLCKAVKSNQRYRYRLADSEI